jgi:diguanylate cyclase (GGDEF)-like protein
MQSGPPALGRGVAAVPPVLDLPTDIGFDTAARLVLGYLTEHVPLAFWSVTRVENGRQTYLHLSEDNGYGLPQGGSHPWAESFCIHMAAGTAPTVALDAQAVPLYASAGVNKAVQIGSYAGAVIAEPDGSLFGAICGIDPKVRHDDPALAAAAPLLRVFGQLLTMILAANRLRDEASRVALMAQAESESDPLTGLLNRRAWDRLVEAESARFSALGDPTVVVMLDLDRLKAVNDEHGHAAGDAYIQAASSALQAAVRAGDIVARLGGDEFGVLMPGCTEALAPQRVGQIETLLSAADVKGSLGWAPISVQRGFRAALAEADAAMYAAKRAGGGSVRSTPGPPLPLPRSEPGPATKA